jgi:ethanolamine utilization protein EutA (predicted chaperonin)
MYVLDTHETDSKYAKLVPKIKSIVNAHAPFRNYHNHIQIAKQNVRRNYAKPPRPRLQICTKLICIGTYTNTFQPVIINRD